MNGGVAVARIFGVEIRLSVTLAMLLAVVTIVGAEEAATTDPALGGAVHWVIGAVVALAFLVSIVGHELAHVLTGRRRGVATSTVVLGFVGALAPLAIEAKRPRDELAIAVAGPLLSLAIAAVLLPVAFVADGGGPALATISGGLLVVGGLNLVLGVLSLLPGVPLDGGRAVRALAWSRTGDTDRAGRVTVTVSRALGWVVSGVGIALILGDRLSEGLLLVALGWLLSGGSRTLERRLILERALRGAVVGDALLEDVPRIPVHLTVDTFASSMAAPDGPQAAAVVDGDRVVGVLGTLRLRRLGAKRAMVMRAGDAMVSPPTAPFVERTRALWDVVELMNGRMLEALAVVEDGALVGLVTQQSVAGVIRERLPDIQLRRRRVRGR